MDIEPIVSVEYERERQLAEAAKDAGRLEEALAHFSASIDAARRTGDADLVDRATCNRAAVAIALGHGEDPIPKLCAILLRNRSQVSSFLAANTIARACELRRDHAKGIFYARIALERAESLGRTDWVAAAHNQIANLMLADSEFEQAARGYHEALALVPGADSPRQLAYLANLGYCEVVLGRVRAGLGVLYRCLRTARRHGWQRLEMIARIDLCYAHIENGRFEHAQRHGTIGLRLAEASAEIDWVKNALYLLGEASVLDGASKQAYAWFHELQRRFYPQQRHLPDLLLSVDIRKLINLRA